MIGPFKSVSVGFAFAWLVASGTITEPANASIVTFNRSVAFNAAIMGSPVTVEQYTGGTDGQIIADGGSFDGLIYNFTAGPLGRLSGGIITSQFNSFSGLSAAGNQSTGEHFFFGGDQVTITFPTPITAVGVFFNVNLNSGGYDLITPAGNVVTESAAYDTRSFVFDGLISTTPFSSITLASDIVSLGSYNIPEIEFVSVPEPTTVTLLLAALFGLGVATSSWTLLRAKNQQCWPRYLG